MAFFDLLYAGVKNFFSRAVCQIVTLAIFPSLCKTEGKFCNDQNGKKILSGVKDYVLYSQSECFRGDGFAWHADVRSDSGDRSGCNG